MNLDHNGQSDAPSTERMTGRRANREAHAHSHVSQARRGAKRVVWGIYHHGFSSRKRVIVSLLILLFVPIIVVQLFYSRDSLLPNMSVGSVSLSGMSRDKATKALNDTYDAAKVPIYFSDSDEVVIRPSLADLGVETDNEARVAAYDYPVWARFVPYSLFWYQSMIERGEPKVFYNTATTAGYINVKFGEDCEFAPVSATIAYRDDALRVIEATRGGSCDPIELRSKLAQVPAQLDPARITINGTSTAPEIHTAEAEKEMARLQNELADGVAFVVDGETRILKRETVEPWIVYSTDGGELALGVSGDVFNDWLSDEYGERFTKDAGISVVKLVDYAEASRESGKEGKYINTEVTAANLVADLQGDSDTTELKVETIAPAVTYERSYSPSNAALSKVMENYANSHPGTYGVKMVELSGERRNAEYRSTTLYTTASTYKMFVAYSVLLRIERGEYTWDQASYGGLSVSTCFDRMIELSNNECAVWFLLDIGQANVTQDAHDIGATETTFLRNDGIKSNAANEAHLLSLLYTGQILSQQASRDRMIEAMKGNVYVKGIPSGIPNATIADKVGFLDGWLHDAAIVYSPKGDYVLIILTEYSSWANIAELAGEIEAAR